MKLIEKSKNSGVQYQVSVEKLADSPFHNVKVVKQIHGLDHEFLFDDDFFLSPEYQMIADLSDKLDGLIAEGAYIKRGEKTRDVNRFAEVIDWMFEEARKGLNIQRLYRRK